MKKNKHSKKAQLRTLLNRIVIVAKRGVNFSFYQGWDEALNETELSLLHDEMELDQLEEKII